MRARCFRRNVLMFLEAHVTSGTPSLPLSEPEGAMYAFHVEAVRVDPGRASPHWGAQALLAEPFPCRLGLFLQPERSRKAARAVLSQVAELDGDLLDHLSGEISRFSSAAASGGREGLVISVDIQVFIPAIRRGSGDFGATDTTAD